MKTTQLLQIKNFKKNLVLNFVLLILLYIALFHKLGSASIYLWDEGVYATNALEMIKRGELLTKYFDGLEEKWGTQPPLVAWIQSLSILILGPTEFAVRFPSALCGLILIIVLIHFFHHEFNNTTLGYFISYVILTTKGFITYHVVRTGDLDAYLALFTTLSFIFFYKYFKSGFRKSKYLYLFVVFLIAAYYAKSAAALLFLPGLFLFILMEKKLKPLLIKKEIYLAILMFLAAISAYYVTKEIITPGYLKQAFYREFYRFFEVYEGHSGPITFYLDYIFHSAFVPWLAFIPLCAVFYFVEKNNDLKKLLLFVSVNAIVFLITISSSRTKIDWYSAPLFPQLAILVGFVIYNIYEKVLNSFSLKFNTVPQQIVAFLFIISIFFFPAKEIVKNINNQANNHSWKPQAFGKALKEIKKEFPDIKKITLFYLDFNPQIVFYKTLYNDYYGYDIDYVGYDIPNMKKITTFDFEENSYIVFYEDKVYQKLRQEFDYEPLKTIDHLQFVKVKNRKHP